MNICPKCFYFVWFSPTHNFRNWSHSYCVQPASILNPKREISFYTYCSIWSNDQMMSKGVFAFVCCGTRRNFFFFVKEAEVIETGYYWMILTKFHLSWYFAGIVLTNLCGLWDFPFPWPVLSSYWNVRMCLVSCSVTFQFLFCFKDELKRFVKRNFKIIILSNGWCRNQGSFFKPLS